MANVIEFVIRGNSDEAIKAMGKMRESLAKVAKVALAVKAAFDVAFAFAIKSIIEVGSKVENLKIRLNALLGSTKEGGKAFEEMAKFAATVPFSFDAIMESATTLAGVVTGGVDEISQMMPIIADLATVSGLSIQDTTSQVQRMMASGAASADMFRERGVLAMLGFQSGVAVSAKETKRRLIEAFEDPASKFAGASANMATTWDGVLSMIGDKWFTLKNNIADEGIFNFIKAIAITIDKMLGGALENSSTAAKDFSDFMIDSLRSIISEVGFLLDVFKGLQVVWKILEVAFADFAEMTIGLIFTIVDGWRQLANLIPGMNLGKLDTMNSMFSEATGRTQELKNELATLMEEGMPSAKIDEFAEKVELTFTKLKELGKGTVESLTAPMETLTEFQTEWNLAQKGFLDEMKGSYTDFSKEFFATMKSMMKSISDGIATSIVEGENMAKVFSNIGKSILKQLISMFIQLIIKRALFSVTDRAASTQEASRSVGLAVANGVASWAKAPYPINIGAPAFGASMGAAAASGAAVASAHGGLTNVPNESTYLLQKGERVLSPNQNSDFTSFINNSEGGGGRGIVIENLSISILENATNIDSLLNLSEPEMEELVAGRIIKSLDALNEQGIRPESQEKE
ncbi:hypothetical protein KAR91_47680 [Candidatus Pacearchaeota archaeon]|nr:hypothetical protein [Candidatus Pacearchaeota archaeon]